MRTENTAFPEELRLQFRNVVNTRCGLYFRDYDLRDLDKAIAERMRAIGMESPASYYNLLIFSEKREDEFRELLNILTIKHTYFFRNEPQFKVLKERIIPEIMERRLRPTNDERRTTRSSQSSVSGRPDARPARSLIR
jgi:chemotaxis protein methyltransferase CheR